MTKITNLNRGKTWLDRGLAALPWLIGVLFGGVALHLVAILALPALAPNSAYRIFVRPLPLGEKRTLSRAEPSMPRPAFADPFAAIALCRFDLREGLHPFETFQ